jgi:hypothetical protein
MSLLPGAFTPIGRPMQSINRLGCGTSYDLAEIARYDVPFPLGSSHSEKRCRGVPVRVEIGRAGAVVRDLLGGTG